MEHTKLTELLNKVAQGEVSVEKAALELKTEPFEDLGFAKLDHHRKIRQGAAEVIYGAGKTPELMSAQVIVVVAGMEGALASVVGGLADCPVIAVPTSVGYGASFGGLSALLSMLNSCASGVSVVNIDNGFGAGYMASMINHVSMKNAENLN